MPIHAQVGDFGTARLAESSGLTPKTQSSASARTRDSASIHYSYNPLFFAGGESDDVEHDTGRLSGSADAWVDMTQGVCGELQPELFLSRL
jgi:hypothetical protein